VGRGRGEISGTEVVSETTDLTPAANITLLGTQQRAKRHRWCVLRTFENGSDVVPLRREREPNRCFCGGADVRQTQKSMTSAFRHPMSHHRTSVSVQPTSDHAHHDT